MRKWIILLLLLLVSTAVAQPVAERPAEREAIEAAGMRPTDAVRARRYLINSGQVTPSVAVWAPPIMPPSTIRPVWEPWRGTVPTSIGPAQSPGPVRPTQNWVPFNPGPTGPMWGAPPPNVEAAGPSRAVGQQNPANGNGGGIGGSGGGEDGPILETVRSEVRRYQRMAQGPTCASIGGCAKNPTGYGEGYAIIRDVDGIHAAGRSSCFNCQSEVSVGRSSNGFWRYRVLAAPGSPGGFQPGSRDPNHCAIREPSVDPQEHKDQNGPIPMGALEAREGAMTHMILDMKVRTWAAQEQAPTLIGPATVNTSVRQGPGGALVRQLGPHDETDPKIRLPEAREPAPPPEPSPTSRAGRIWDLLFRHK